MTAMQYAVLPFRRRDGVLEILMVTSRETARWVVPKGWPMAGLTPADAAAREAYEEAGITGVVGRAPIGGYTYWKIITGKRLLCTVEVYPFEVHEELAQWPERRQRKREWFSPGAAVSLVDEAVLGEIIRRCDAEPDLTDLPRPRRKKKAVTTPPAKGPAKGKKAPARKAKKAPAGKTKKAPARKARKPVDVVFEPHDAAAAKVPAAGRKAKSRKPAKAKSKSSKSRINSKSKPRSRPVLAFEDVAGFDPALEAQPALEAKPATKTKPASKAKSASKTGPKSKAHAKPKAKASGKSAEAKARQKAGGPSRKKRAGRPKGKKKHRARS